MAPQRGGEGNHGEGIGAGAQFGTVARSLGARAVGWPSDEIDLLIAAWIAGNTDDEIRALVTKLEANRKSAW